MNVTIEGYLTKKGGLSWKQRYFQLEANLENPRITYFAKEGETKIRGEIGINAEVRECALTCMQTRPNAPVFANLVGFVDVLG